MRNSILFVVAILSLINVSLTAQNESKVDLSAYKISDNTISYSNYSSNNKQLIITLLDSVSLDLIVLDDALNRTQDSISYELPSVGYNVENTIINKSAINYLVAKKDGYMSVLKYSRKDKKWEMGNSLLKDGENFLASFSYQNKFYVFNYEKKAGIIKTYTAELNGLLPFKDFNFSDFKLGENDLSYFLKKKKKALKVITSDSPNELFASRKSKKVYQFDEKIYFTIDDTITRATSVIQFNLKTKKHTVSNFNNVKAECVSYQFNKSTLTRNHLAIISGCVENATITLWDLKTKNIVKTIELVQDELITMKNYDNLISPNKAHSIEVLKSKVLLRKLTTGEASIYLNEYKNNLELLVGRLTIKNKRDKNRMKKSGGKGKGDGSGGGRQKKLDRIEKQKIKGLGLSKSYLNYESAKPQYFVSNLNLITKKIDVNAPYQNTFESINAYKTKHNLKQERIQILFKKNDVFWFGYVDSSTKKLHLIKID